MPPSEPGIGNAPILPSRSGLASTIAPTSSCRRSSSPPRRGERVAQVEPRPTWSPPASRSRARWPARCRSRSPRWASGWSSPDVHVPSSPWVAISPPAPQMNGSTPYSLSPAIGNGMMSGSAFWIALPTSTSSSQSVGQLDDPGLLEDVGAVDDRAHAGVPRHAVERPVDGAGLDEGRARGPRISPVVLDLFGEVEEHAGVGELGRPRGADLGHVGQRAAGDRRRERSWASAHWTNCTSSVAPVSASKAVATSSKNGSASGFVPSMIQTVSVSPEDSGEAAEAPAAIGPSSAAAAATPSPARVSALRRDLIVMFPFRCGVANGRGFVKMVNEPPGDSGRAIALPSRRPPDRYPLEDGLSR